ncbi:zf-HC2 domain-containing protein [Fervidibacter sacchari]
MEHITQEQWERYKTMDLDTEELVRIDEHLAKCGECRKRLLSEDQLERAIDRLHRQISAALPTDCITYDLLADYIDGRLSGEEKARVEEHLRVCAYCAEDFRSLAEFRSTMQEKPKELVQPATSQPSWWQRLKNALTSRWIIALEAGAIAFLVLLFAIHQGQQRFATQLQQLGLQIAHLHEHIKGLEGQVQKLQQEQLADLRNQLTAVKQRLEAVAKEERQLAYTTPTLPLMTLKDTAGTVVLTEDKRLEMPIPLASEWRKRVLELLLEGKVSQPENVKVAMAKLGEKVAVRGEIEGLQTIQPISPVKTSVLPDQIIFRWKGVAGANQYRVLVADENGSKILWESQPISKTHLLLPARTLEPGGVYTWQVEAVVGEEKAVSQPVRFWVLDKQSASLVRRMERQFSNSALTLATLYATYGLWDKAIAQVHRLQKQNPDHPAIKLLQEAVSKWSQK